MRLFAIWRYFYPPHATYIDVLHRSVMLLTKNKFENYLVKHLESLCFKTKIRAWGQIGIDYV